MSRVPAARRVVASFVACFTLAVSAGVALTAGSAVPAGADGRNHVAMIIETGAEVHRVVVGFDADSISGLEALALVPGANPSALGFSGLGGAVCALFGVGHPATTSTCLGEPSDPRYWAYWHVPGGQSAFDNSTYSRAGAGSVRVRDGDTEGWRFGTGEPPTFVQLDLPQPTPVTAPPVVADAAPQAGSNGLSGGTAGGEMGLPSTGSTTTTIAPTPEEAAAAAAAAAGAAAGAPTTSSTRKNKTTEVAAQRASASRDAGDGAGSPLPSILGFAAVMVMLAAGIFFARRARAGNRPSAP